MALDGNAAMPGAEVTILPSRLSGFQIGSPAQRLTRSATCSNPAVPRPASGRIAASISPKPVSNQGGSK